MTHTDDVQLPELPDGVSLNQGEGGLPAVAVHTDSAVAEHLFAAGHPVHVLDQLGYNTGTIPAMATIVRDHLRRLDADDVTIVAHSKGGLIGKQALAEEETRVRQILQEIGLIQ